MKISPPITVIAILAVGLAMVPFISSEKTQPQEVTIKISAETYNVLKSIGSKSTSPNVRSLGVSDVIDKLVREHEVTVIERGEYQPLAPVKPL